MLSAPRLQRHRAPGAFRYDPLRVRCAGPSKSPPSNNAGIRTHGHRASTKQTAHDVADAACTDLRAREGIRALARLYAVPSTEPTAETQPSKRRLTVTLGASDHISRSRRIAGGVTSCRSLAVPARARTVRQTSRPLAIGVDGQRFSRLVMAPHARVAARDNRNTLLGQ